MFRNSTSKFDPYINAINELAGANSYLRSSMQEHTRFPDSRSGKSVSKLGDNDYMFHDQETGVSIITPHIKKLPIPAQKEANATAQAGTMKLLEAISRPVENGIPFSQYGDFAADMPQSIMGLKKMGAISEDEAREMIKGAQGIFMNNMRNVNTNRTMQQETPYKYENARKMLMQRGYTQNQAGDALLLSHPDHIESLYREYVSGLKATKNTLDDMIESLEKQFDNLADSNADNAGQLRTDLQNRIVEMKSEKVQLNAELRIASGQAFKRQQQEKNAEIADQTMQILEMALDRGDIDADYLKEAKKDMESIGTQGALAPEDLDVLIAKATNKSQLQEGPLKISKPSTKKKKKSKSSPPVKYKGMSEAIPLAALPDEDLPESLAEMFAAGEMGYEDGMAVKKKPRKSRKKVDENLTNPVRAFLDAVFTKEGRSRSGRGLVDLSDIDVDLSDIDDVFTE